MQRPRNGHPLCSPRGVSEPKREIVRKLFPGTIAELCCARQNWRAQRLTRANARGLTRGASSSKRLLRSRTLREGHGRGNNGLKFRATFADEPPGGESSVNAPRIVNQKNKRYAVICLRSPRGQFRTRNSQFARCFDRTG